MHRAPGTCAKGARPRRRGESPLMQAPCPTDRSRRSRAGPRRLLWFVPLLFVAGCGPTPAQMLMYEVVLAHFGLLLGLGIWLLGWRIGRRWAVRWYHCRHCGAPNAAAPPPAREQQCPSCGRASAVDALPWRQLRQAGIRRLSVLPRRRAAAAAAALAPATMALLAVPWAVRHWMVPGTWELPEYEQILGFALTYAFTEPAPYPSLGPGLLFFSYELVCAIKPSSPAWLVCGYLGVFLTLTGHWYMGLRRLPWGWIVPAGLTLVNTGIAFVLYCVRIQ